MNWYFLSVKQQSNAKENEVVYNLKNNLKIQKNVTTTNFVILFYFLNI